jgi:hypothetical protein
MAISATTNVTASNTSAGTSLSCFAFTATAGQDVLVAVALQNTSASVLSITDTAGNTYSMIGVETNSGHARLELWGASNISGNASNVVTVNVSASSLLSISVNEYAGLSSGVFTALNRTGWTCTATSNVFGSGGQPTGAVGGTNGPWITVPNPQSISVDMLSAQSFNCLQLTPNQGNAIPTAYTLDVSDDGSTWTSTGESISGLPVAVAMQQWTLSTSYSHRYFRINVTADNGFVSLASIFAGILSAARSPHFQLVQSSQTVSSTLSIGQPVGFSGDWSLAAFAFVSNSGDSVTAVNGTLRSSVVPSVTSVALAVLDNTAAAVLQATLSAGVQPWAAVGCDLVSDGAELNLPTAANNAEHTKADHQLVKPPAIVMGGGGGSGVFPYVSAIQGGTVGSAYSETVDIAGVSSPPYTFAVTSGALPSGLSLNTSTGVISGTPTIAGTSTFTITATDATSQTGSQTFSIDVVNPSTGAAGGSFAFVA